MARTYAGFHFVKTKDGGPVSLMHVKATAGTYYEGNVVRVNAFGYAAKYAQGTGASPSVFGVVAADAAVAAGSGGKLAVIPLDDNNIFEARMAPASTPSAKVLGRVQLNISGNDFKIGGTVYKGENTATLRVVAVHPDDADKTSTANLRYWVMGLTKLNQLDGAGLATQ